MSNISYTLIGDYYYSDFLLPEEPIGDIGRYGRMRL